MINQNSMGKTARVALLTATLLGSTPPTTWAANCEICEHNGVEWTGWVPIGNGYWQRTKTEYVATCNPNNYDHLICRFVAGNQYEVAVTTYTKAPDGYISRVTTIVWRSPDCTSDDGTGCTTNPEE